MSNSSYYDILSGDIDEEDMQYLQTSFCELFTKTNQRSNNDKENFSSSKESDTFASVLNRHNSTCRNWAGKVKRHYDEKCSDDSSDSGYRSVLSPVLPKRQYSSTMLYSDIVEQGINSEDMYFLKKEFKSLLRDNDNSYWTKELCWDSHPITASDDPVFDTKTTDRYHLNKTGSARTEGYFKIDKLLMLKKNNRRLQRPSKSDENAFAPYIKNYKGNKQSMSRDARNDQRRLSTAYQMITDSDLLKLNELKFRKKKLRLGKSEIHGLGLFASEPIAPNEIIIEYVGQIIRPVIADLREKNYSQYGIGSYCFRIDEDTIVDATKHGNLNRYINHSCNPNSYAKILNINNQKKIVIYSKKSINIDEEITYDYKMPYEDDKIVCFCRAPGCRKSLN